MAGFLAAGFDNDGFYVTAVTQRLHGRRIRGKRIIFPEELVSTPEVAPVEEYIEPLPDLAPVAAAITEAKNQLETAKRAKVRKGAETALQAATARYNDAKDRENAIIQRLRDEDELWLLAA